MDDFDFYIILRPIDREKTAFYRIYATYLNRQLLVERDCTGLSGNQWIIERFTLRLNKNDARVLIFCQADKDQQLEIYEAAFNDRKFLKFLPNVNRFHFQGYQIDLKIKYT
jgi:hypothetical protein